MDGTRPPVGPDLCTVDPMRTRIVRTLSAGAVLVTAAGITIGSQGLGSPPVSASASSSSTPTTTPGAGSAASSVPVTAAVTPVPGTTTQFSYVAGDAATVVVDSAGGVLRIVTFTPHPGWFTLRLDQPNMTQFEVRLESSTGQVRFAAALVDGAIVPQLEVGTAPSGSVPDTAPGNSGPGNSAPDNSAPGNSAPGNSAPGNSTPGNTAPDGDDNGGDDDGGDDNSGPGGGGDDSGGDDSGGDDNSGSGGGDDG